MPGLVQGTPDRVQGLQISPEDRLVPAMRTEAHGTEAATPSPMHLSSFLQSPVEPTPSQSLQPPPS